MDKPENGLSFALTRLASSSPSSLMATSHIPAPLYVVNAESRLVKKAQMCFVQDTDVHFD